MAVFSVAPSVKWSERDATLFTKATIDIAAGQAGFAVWGPAEKVVSLTLGEEEKVSIFGKPDDQTYLDHFVMADYMQYAKAYHFYRVVGTNARNAVPTGQTAVKVSNKNVFDGFTFSPSVHAIARYPGSLGNSLKLMVADNASYDSFEYKDLFEYKPKANERCACVVDTTGAITGLAGAINQVEGFTVTGKATAAGTLEIAGVSISIAKDATAATVASNIQAGFSSNTTYDVTNTGANVRFTHKTKGLKAVIPAITGGPAGISIVNQSVTTYGSSGQVIPGEKWELLQLTAGAKRTDGSAAYFYDVINNGSKYVYVTSRTTLNAGETEFQGGVDDYDTTRIAGYQELSNGEAYDLDSIIGVGSVAEQQAAIDAAVTRRDAVAFVSPTMEAVVNNAGNEIASITTWVTQLGRDNSYMFMDDNWALVWDKYTENVRWIPTCGGTAGLYARTKGLIGPWKSPAFHNRGKYKGYRRLAWSAKDTQRTPLYKLAVNSIVTFPKEGPILYGDKTGLSRPSAFSRINVRGTFIMMEKNIATTAKYFLGENNDEFTRALFSNTVRPYIRDLEDQGAIIKGKVKCDGDNNTGQVIANNQFVAGIFVKPQSSINWILLDFAAVRADMSFDEVEGASGLVTAD
ncbi:tail sheath protein [Vibrio phage BX-1]|nr:tail sheath protein [Vibrio phage BX-1]